MKNNIVHFDTKDNTNPDMNPYNNCILNLASPIEDVKNIKLKSIELPLYLSTTITTSMNTLRYYITAADLNGREDFAPDPLPIGNYDILQLLSRLGECYKTGNSHTIFYLNSSNKVCVEVVFASCFTFLFHFIQCPLLKLLGYSGTESFFRKEGYTDNNGNYYPDWSVMTMTFQNEYNLYLYTPNPHTYVYLQLQNPNSGGKSFRYKIPLKNHSISNPPVYYQKETFEQKIELENNSVVDSLEVSLIDRFGNVFDGTHVHYSFTLDFETE